MATGVLNKAYEYIVNICNDIDPITQEQSEPGYAYFVAGSGNDAQRWGREILNGYYRYDCSSLIGAALIHAGMLPPEIYPYFWTGNMEQILKENGFVMFDPMLNTLQQGDILLTHNNQMQHTEMLYEYNPYDKSWYSMGARSSHLPINEQISIHKAYMPQWELAFRPKPLQSIIPDNQIFFAKRTGGFERNSGYAFSNACMTASILMTSVKFSEDTEPVAYTWSKQAVCGLLGNIEIECGYNFGRWENDILETSIGYYRTVYEAETTEELYPYGGYGCVQFTPAWRYIGTNTYGKFDGSLDLTSPTNIVGASRNYWGFLPNFADQYTAEDGIIMFFDDAYAQLVFLANEWCRTNWYPTTQCPETFEEFYSYIKDDNVEYLAEVFCRNLERPNMDVAQLETRKEAARYWWNKLNNWIPIIPEKPDFRKGKEELWKKIMCPSINIKL